MFVQRVKNVVILVGYELVIPFIFGGKNRKNHHQPPSTINIKNFTTE